MAGDRGSYRRPFCPSVISSAMPPIRAPITGTPAAKTTVVQHLQTIFFAVKDTAGNSKTFSVTIYLDPTAPRTGGSANPTGSTTPSASMIGLASQNGVIYVIDLETFLIIDSTKKTN